MNLGEVSILTKLPEQAVSYYIERDLITLRKEYIKGSEYSEFTEKNVRELVEVATLRKANFSVDDILSMKRAQWNIPVAVQRWYKESDSDLTRKVKLIKSIDTDKLFQAKSIEEIVECLKDAVHEYKIPTEDIQQETTFKFDDITEEEKALLVKQFKNKREKSYRQGEIITIVIVSLCILQGLISFIDRIISGRSGNLFGSFILFIVDVAVAIALYLGVVWIKHVFCILNIVGVFAKFYILFGAEYSQSIIMELGTFGVVVQLISIGYLTISTYLIYKHPGVNEFLYGQKHN